MFYLQSWLFASFQRVLLKGKSFPHLLNSMKYKQPFALFFQIGVHKNFAIFTGKFIHGQFSTWKNVNAGVPQDSILDLLLFFIFINDLTEGHSSNAKLFADGTALFSVTATQRKINFNPNTTKQVISFSIFGLTLS